MKQKEAMKKVAFEEHRNLFQIFQARKYINIFTELLKVFTASCGKGHRVDFNWLWSKAWNVYQDQECQGAMVKKHVVKSFIKRHHLKYFRVQWNKNKSKEAFRVKLVKWHETLCERLVCTGAKESCYEEKWGYYKPHQRLNVYQSPLSFAIECKKTSWWTFLFIEHLIYSRRNTATDCRYFQKQRKANISGWKRGMVPWHRCLL